MQRFKTRHCKLLQGRTGQDSLLPTNRGQNILREAELVSEPGSTIAIVYRNDKFFQFPPVSPAATLSNLAPSSTVVRAEMKRRLYFGLAILLLVLSQAVLAQVTSTPSPVGAVAGAPAGAQTDPLGRLEQQVEDAKSSADNAWMLVSAALVLMMTGPGLALFYGGLVRKKNVLARSRCPHKVEDSCSGRTTLLQVIARDRPGLLYTLSSRLSREKGNIEMALIETEGQTAIDVFYLTSGGAKVPLEQERHLRAALLEELREE